jgi:D-amino peptidase
MKIFIAVDMEGATGVVHPDQLMPDGRGYAAAQRMLTTDVQAVIQGILDESPNAEIVVGEGHAIMRNVLLDEMPEQASVVVGPARPENKPLCQLEGLDSSFDGLFLVGYHAMAGRQQGLLAHTYVGSLVHSFELNGRQVGEVEVNAAIAGSMGVPLALVAGNSDLAEEMAFAPWTTFVSTKQVLGPTAAICLPPKRTAKLLRENAASAVRSIVQHHAPPYVVQCPISMRITMHRRDQATRAAGGGGVTVIGDRAIEARGDDAAEVFRTIWRALCLAMAEHPTWLQ